MNYVLEAGRNSRDSMERERDQGLLQGLLPGQSGRSGQQPRGQSLKVAGQGTMWNPLLPGYHEELKGHPSGAQCATWNPMASIMGEIRRGLQMLKG